MNFKKLQYFFFQAPRIFQYILLSYNKNITGKAIITQPVLYAGKGKILIGNNVRIGYYRAPYFFNGYAYIDARNINSTIKFGDNVQINNNFSIISEGEGIEIGNNTIIGTNVEIYDSDFHALDPEKRINGVPQTGKIVIGNNVFIGSNTKILKNVTIGHNSVIGSSSVVTRSVPDNTVVAGNPAKIIKSLESI